MTLYTINLSRARMAGSNKRAKKAMSILKEELENREGEVSISGEVNQEIWSRGASKPPAKIQVEVVDTSAGKRAVLPGEEYEEEPEPEPEPEETEEEEVEEEDTEEAGETEADYDEIVSGTVQEAKDALNEMDDPDYGAALEAEKAGKDRKTLKEFLEGKQ
ncbi:MAG: hypothetical protein ABEJ69_00960 [Candidatus Nanohaloarchaea archaeon]